MPAALRILDEAKRRSDALNRRLGDELRRARLHAGLSQAAVGHAIGCSGSTISRRESASIRSVSVDDVMRHGAVVGLVLRADLLPLGSPLRDAGQLRVLNRLQPNVAPPFQWSVEWPVRSDDLRAFDAVAIAPGCRIAFEVWSRARDVQAQARSSMRKQVDGRMDRLVLVFGSTWTNRRAVGDAGDALLRSFPITSRRVLDALRSGRDPGGNGIVFI
jgi:transcriptional regulator with XRE-family HTH domain